MGMAITNLGVTLEFELGCCLPGQKNEVIYRAFFINDTNEIVSDAKEIKIACGEQTKIMFSLSPKVSSAASCFLALQSSDDAADELQQLIPFEVKISFTLDFDF